MTVLALLGVVIPKVGYLNSNQYDKFETITENSSCWSWYDNNLKTLNNVRQRFRIQSGNYGGELTIGEISKEFVDYFIGKDQSDLISTAGI